MSLSPGKPILTQPALLSLLVPARKGRRLFEHGSSWFVSPMSDPLMDRTQQLLEPSIVFIVLMAGEVLHRVRGG